MGAWLELNRNSLAAEVGKGIPGRRCPMCRQEDMNSCGGCWRRGPEQKIYMREAWQEIWLGKVGKGQLREAHDGTC